MLLAELREIGKAAEEGGEEGNYRLDEPYTSTGSI
jgi:hypothetical protein